MGNVPKETSLKTLTRFFAQFGAVESARLRSMPTAGAKVSEAGNQALVRRVAALRGALTDAKATVNAYVVFKTAEDAVKCAAAANGLEFSAVSPEGEKQVAPLSGKKFHLRVDVVAAQRAADEHLRTAFVGNAPRNTSEEGLRNLFAAHLAGHGGHAAIENVRVIRDPATHKGIGICYVVLRDKSTLSAALELDGTPHAEKEGGRPLPKGVGRPLRVRACGKRTRTSTQADGGAAPHDTRRDKRTKEKNAKHPALRRAGNTSVAGTKRPRDRDEATDADQLATAYDDGMRGGDGGPKPKKPRHVARGGDAASDSKSKSNEAKPKKQASPAKPWMGRTATPAGEVAAPKKPPSAFAQSKKAAAKGGKPRPKGPNKAKAPKPATA